MQEEAQPDTDAAAGIAHLVHAIVPVARADARQPVRAQGVQRMREGARAVHVEAGGFPGRGGVVVVGRFAGIERAPFDEAHVFFQYAHIAGDVHVVAGGERQPQIIVGTTGADAPVGRRVPPMQHVALHELLGRAAQQVGARQLGARDRQRHHVLQLVPEAVRAARLVMATACP
ncbi:hypothetical protein G6F35_015198 [Rhizopus arrhizus]|nr:hypothetical protein G6F35_015198 [Rhizopus arrhizus]